MKSNTTTAEKRFNALRRAAQAVLKIAYSGDEGDHYSETFVPAFDALRLAVRQSRSGNGRSRSA